MIFELVQLSEYCDGAVRLASYSTNARDFLFPILSLAPKYTSTDREILFCRTVAFPVSEHCVDCHFSSRIFWKAGGFERFLAAIKFFFLI